MTTLLKLPIMVVTSITLIFSCSLPGTNGTKPNGTTRQHLLSPRNVADVGSNSTKISTVQQGTLLFSSMAPRTGGARLDRLDLLTGEIREVYSASIPVNGSFLIGNDILIAGEGLYTVPRDARQTTELLDYSSAGLEGRFAISNGWLYFVEIDSPGFLNTCHIGRISVASTVNSQLQWLNDGSSFCDPVITTDGQQIFVSTHDSSSGIVCLYTVDEASDSLVLLTSINASDAFTSKFANPSTNVLSSVSCLYLIVNGSKIVEIDKATNKVVSTENIDVWEKSTLVINDQLYFFSGGKLKKYKSGGSEQLTDMSLPDLQASGTSDRYAVASIGGKFAVVVSADIMNTSSRVYTYNDATKDFEKYVDFSGDYPFYGHKYYEDANKISFGTGGRFATYISKSDFSSSTVPFGYLPYNIFNANPVAETDDSIIALGGYGQYSRLITIPKGGSVYPKLLYPTDNQSSVVDSAYKDGTLIWISRQYTDDPAFAIYSTNNLDFSSIQAIKTYNCDNIDYNLPKRIYLSDDYYLVEVETLVDHHWYLYSRKTNSQIGDLASIDAVWGLQNIANVGTSLFLGSSSGITRVDLSRMSSSTVSSEFIKDISTIDGRLYWISDSGLYRIADDGQVEQLYVGSCYSMKGDLMNLFVVADNKILQLVLN